VADKQPTTNGGRSIVLGMLFLTLMMQAVYTGSLNAFLMSAPMAPLVHSKSVFLSNNKLKLCTPSESTREYLKTFMDPVATRPIQTTNGTDIRDCMWKVYLGEADATLFDEPVAKWRIANRFHQRGHCGADGGYCFDSENKTVLKEVSWDQCTQDKWMQKQPDTPGSLEPVGQIFSNFGYGFAFPKKTSTGTPSSDYMVFSQLINFVKERGHVDEIEATRKISLTVTRVRAAVNGDGVLTLRVYACDRVQT
jgi:hypothetical protein